MGTVDPPAAVVPNWNITLAFECEFFVCIVSLMVYQSVTSSKTSPKAAAN